MKAIVRYNEDAEPTRIEVSQRGNSHTLKANVDGSTAVITVIEPVKGEDVAYADDVKRLMDYMESLPFVQAVALDEYREEEQ